MARSPFQQLQRMMAAPRGTYAEWTACRLNMLKDEKMYDVFFKVGGEEKPIGAHKLVLSNRSPVFHTMFKEVLPEIKEISIPQVDKSTFHSFLGYIYSDEVPIINEDNFEGMFNLSDTYRIPRIKKECKKFLRKTASTSDAAKTLQIAHKYGLDSLVDQSISYIEKNTRKCLSSKYALHLPKECLELILKSENIGYIEFGRCPFTENELHSFLQKWTKSHFDLTKKEVNEKDILNMVETLLSLARFPRVPVAARYVYTATRFQDLVYWKSDGVEALQFQTNKDIWLKGVAIGSIWYNQNNYQIPLISCRIHFEVLSDDYKEIYSYDITVFSSQNCLTFIPFPDPVKISESRIYTIKMEGLQVSAYGSLNCLYSVSVGDLTFKFEESPLCTSGADEKKGQFAGLMFSF